MSLSLDSVGKRVSYARKYRSLTQQELADRAGIAQSSLASLEAGRNKGSRSLVSLAKALGVPPEWLDSGQAQGKTVQELLMGALPQDASNTQKSIHDVLKNAVLGEFTSEYQQSEASFSSTAQPIGLKLLAWTARSLLDPDTAYKQQLEQQRRFQWPFPHGSRAFLLRATRDFHIPNLREGDFLLIEPDAPVEAGRHIVVVRSDDEILLGRVVDTTVSKFLLLAAEPGQEQLYPLDATIRVVGIISSRLQGV
jgi:transcriptional regulator with XRE-family HTH domain